MLNYIKCKIIFMTGCYDTYLILARDILRYILIYSHTYRYNKKINIFRRKFNFLNRRTYYYYNLISSVINKLYLLLKSDTIY